MQKRSKTYGNLFQVFLALLVGQPLGSLLLDPPQLGLLEVLLHLTTGHMCGDVVMAQTQFPHSNTADPELSIMETV